MKHGKWQSVTMPSSSLSVIDGEKADFLVEMCSIKIAK